MSLTHALLGVLEARPMNGYELTKSFDSAERWLWAAPQSQIYTTLRKMQQHGLIEGAEQIRGTRLATHVYSITPKGRDELADWAATPHQQPPIRDAFLLQAYFLDGVSPEAAEVVVREYIAANERLVEQWAARRDVLLGKEPPRAKAYFRPRPADRDEPVTQLKAHVLQGQIDRAAEALAWAREALRIIQGCDIQDHDISS